jgi:hypothetical protein
MTESLIPLANCYSNVTDSNYHELINRLSLQTKLERTSPPPKFCYIDNPLHSDEHSLRVRLRITLEKL